MPATDARDIVDTAEADEPSPNEVSGYYERDPKTNKVTSNWVPPVDPTTLDPDVHRAVIPYEDRGSDAALSVPLAEVASPSH